MCSGNSVGVSIGVGPPNNVGADRLGMSACRCRSESEVSGRGVQWAEARETDRWANARETNRYSPAAPVRSCMPHRLLFGVRNSANMPRVITRRSLDFSAILLRNCDCQFVSPFSVTYRNNLYSYKNSWSVLADRSSPPERTAALLDDRRGQGHSKIVRRQAYFVSTNIIGFGSFLQSSAADLFVHGVLQCLRHAGDPPRRAASRRQRAAGGVSAP